MTLDEVAWQGYSKIFVLRSTKALGATRDRPTSWILASTYLGLAVLPVNLIAIVLHEDLGVGTTAAWFWLTAFGAVNVGMLCSAWTAWSGISWNAINIESLLTDPSDRIRLVSWLDRAMRFRQQLAASLVIVILVETVFYVLHRTIAEHLEIAPTSFVAVGLTAMVGSNVFYWLVVMSDLPRKVQIGRRLNLVRFDPANTPGLAALTRIYFFTASALLLGVLALEVLSLMVPGRQDSAPLTALSIAFAVFAVGLTLQAGLQPLVRVRQMAIRARRVRLEELQRRMQVASLWVPQPPPDHATEYQMLLNAKLLSIDTVSLVQYSAALVGSFVAFVLQLVLP